jgi:Ca2+-binding EF-hand superfamily protein
MIESRARRDSVVTQSFSNLFRKFDKDNDGTVSKQELDEALRSMFGVRMPPSKLDFLFQSMDATNRGAITKFEFLDAFLGHRQPDRFKDTKVEGPAGPAGPPGKTGKTGGRRSSVHGNEDATSLAWADRDAQEQASRLSSIKGHRFEANSGLMSSAQIGKPASLQEIREIIRNKILGRARNNTDISRTMRKVFASMDGNGDGHVDLHEFTQAVLRLFDVKLSAGQARAFFDCLDMDGDGSLSQDELIAGLLMRRGRMDAESSSPKPASQGRQAISTSFQRASPGKPSAEQELQGLREKAERKRQQQAERSLGVPQRQQQAERAERAFGASQSGSSLQPPRQRAPRKATKAKPLDTNAKWARATLNAQATLNRSSQSKSAPRPFESWKPFNAWHC